MIEKKSQPAISVVIPVYNQEKYVGKCIRSVLRQSFKDFEVIIVNDGSTDKSLKICQRYATKDSRISIIEKHNEGVALARKDGVLRSQGEYLFFIDSDDYINQDVFCKLIRLARLYNLDMVETNHDFVFDSWGLISKKSIPFSKGDLILNQKEIMELCFHLDRHKNFNPGVINVWGNLYKRLCVIEALKINESILFPRNKICFSEDLSFNLAVSQFVHSAYMCNEAGYHYRYGGVTSGYYSTLIHSRYYFDYRYDICMEKNDRCAFSFLVKDYAAMVLNEMVKYIHFKVGTETEARAYLLQELPKGKIVQWAQQHSKELTDNVKADENAMAIVNEDMDVFFGLVRSRLKFLRKHHFWKMRIIRYYQMVVDNICFII